MMTKHDEAATCAVSIYAQIRMQSTGHRNVFDQLQRQHIIYPARPAILGIGDWAELHSDCGAASFEIILLVFELAFRRFNPALLLAWTLLR